VEGRLPAHIEVSGIRHLAESLGGFATVLAKGERDSGTIAIVIIGRDEPAELYERMPQLDGNRPFVRSVTEDIDKKEDFSELLARRMARDPDLWLIEADVPDKERFVAALVN
jgi:hypothetical protein